MKRLFDLIVAMVILLLLSPILVLTILLLLFRLGAPIFFCQVRPGLNGETFNIVKFRTMMDFHDQSGNLLPDTQRMNSFGAFLRSTSLDELPELWNVLKGEMSLVGPRPLLVEYLPLYNSKQARRHEVRPGITGWAQVNGRNTLSWEEKFNLDVWYVDNQSLWLDIKILFMTIKKVIIREGISGEGEVTMSKFTGSKS
jgi:lipopolysaccharide/colanic/teichoic acid biosynthesis glycosyltransferase